MSSTARLEPDFVDGDLVEFNNKFETTYSDGRLLSIPKGATARVLGAHLTQARGATGSVFEYSVLVLGTLGVQNEVVNGVPEYLLDMAQSEPDDGRENIADAPPYTPSGVYDTRTLQ